MLLALDEERQPALEHEVNLLLPRVGGIRPRWPGSSTSWFIPKLVTPSGRRSDTKRSPAAGSSRERAIPTPLPRILGKRLAAPAIRGTLSVWGGL